MNVGVSKATEAAKATGGIVAMSPTVGDDANDLFVREGAEAVRTAIDAAMGTGAEKTGPEPLCYEMNPISLSDLILSNLPDPEPLIDGLLYPETVLVIGALVKMHKT